MRIYKILIAILLLILICPQFLWADKIILKRGKVVDGTVVERSDTWIKVEIEGIDITYMLKDVITINGLDPRADLTEATALPLPDAIPMAPVAETPPLSPELEPHATIIKEILELNGLQKHLEGMQGLLKAQLVRCTDTNSAEVCGRVQEVMLESFTPEIFYQSAVETLLANYDEAQLSKIREFVQTPLSKKLVDLEITAQNPASLPEKRGYIEHLMDPTPERKKLIDRMEAATNQTEMTLNLAVQMSDAIYQAVQAALKPEQRSLPNPTPEQLQGFRTQIQPVIQASVFQTFLFNYRYASDEELNQYVAFLESDSGRWFNKILNVSTTRALEKVSSIVSQKILVLEREPPKDSESDRASVQAILKASQNPQ